MHVYPHVIVTVVFENKNLWNVTNISRLQRHFLLRQVDFRLFADVALPAETYELKVKQ